MINTKVKVFFLDIIIIRRDLRRANMGNGDIISPARFIVRICIDIISIILGEYHVE